MCGICGQFNLNKKYIIPAQINLMMSKMKHRGPDDEGIFIKDQVGLGFVRLSILDLSLDGHQPMFSNNGRFVIVFNGEIFNYIEIREELKNKYYFKTRTDTEVVLAAYQEWGEHCLDKFNGMFSFVIYDVVIDEIFGVRDRYGIKPLYYYQNNDEFFFASEIKSILPLLSSKKANNRIISDYLFFNRTDHTCETFFCDIKKLHHGTYFRLSKKGISFHRWYNLSDKIQFNRLLTPDDYRALFIDSLKLRLRADVPIGVSLSGGIDSSVIASSLVKDFGLQQLNTFSAVYDANDSNDESKYIKEFFPIIKNMHFIKPDAPMFFNDFETFIESHNEPVPDIGPYAQYKVMELASKFVKVTLDGQGADEQLAGYHYFFGSYYVELLKQLRLTKFIGENIYYFKKHKSLDALKYFLYYLLPSSIQNKISSTLFPSISKTFLSANRSNLEINEMLYNPKSLNESLIQHFEFKLEHLLRWEDLNAMHFSIESRVPFLDYRLVEATLSTPSNQKIYQGETKHLLREALSDILPAKITNRKDKKGFSNPRDKWFRSEKFQKYIFELINSGSFKKRGYFDSAIANKQYKKHLKNEIDISKEIWKWINLEVWFRKFID